jgi:hypothetical protein
VSDTAISNLQQAVKTAAGTGGAFALDAAFLTKGLNDASVTVPADYDQIVMAAFQLAAASDLSVKADQKNVGAVTGNSFTVTNATIPFLSSTGVPLQTTATLVFAVTTDAKPTLVVQIASAPSSWTWTNSFEFMGGWPFNQLPVTDALFVFSTADGTYPWTNSAASKVKGGGKQNFSAALPLPSVVQPFLKLFSGLTPAANLTLQGVLDMTAYNGTTVLMPPGTLTATLQNGQFSVFYLTVSNPSIAVSIPAPTDDTDDSGQAPTLAVSALLGVGGVSPEQSPYILQVQISPAGTQDAVAYGIGLNATGAGTPLTPDSIVSLIGGNGSYFSGTPSVLQQFLAFVALQGMTINGTLNPATVGQVSILVGSMPNTSWTPIPYPPPGLDFSINEFSLQWSMSNPLDSTRSQSFLFETQFTLMPSIFKGPDGVGDGVFTVRFDSALNFSAMFGGSVSLSDFLSTLSGGAVSLPPSIEASLSDIALTVDFNAKSFNLSSAFDVELAFLTVNDEPILSISDGNVSIGAMTPPQGKSQQTQALSLLSQSHASIMESRPVLPQTEMLIRSTTVAASGGYVWSGSVGGLLGVGPLKANVVVSYDGTLPTPQWNLKAALAQPITVQELIRQFFAAGGVYDFPDFLPGTLTITTFAIAATIPTSSCQKSATTYTIDVSFSWLFTLGDQKIGLNPAKIGLKYDGSLPSGQQFSGMVAATWVYEAINLELLLTYKFAYVQNVANQTLSLTWQGFTATYTSKDNQIAFTLKGWSIGSLIQALVRTLGDPYFTLSSPWDLLNQISLDGLSVIVSLQNGLAFSQRLSASYTLSSPLNLGFIVINSLIFRRDTTGKVTLAIDGSSPISSSLGSLMDPKKGQDVQNLPPVPGRGNDYFKVFLLVLGQRIGISGSSGFANTQAVINALQKVPSTTGKLNPVNPAQGTTPGLPYYNPSNNWLIAGHLGLLRVGSAWTVDLMVVFNDPNLYGLRLALAGTKAGGLAGLAIDILYKKITDDVGLFQINFTFPDSIRNINLGAVSITLPQIGIQIYTNGDFLIDIGFPYNLDFSRSFAIYAIVYGVPVMGAGGFYFGKLSSATATQVPQTTKGTFDPVIVFGIGLQLGLGYNFTKGPLSAGFALTVFGIIEGVIAAWHPYPGQALQRSTTALGDSMQSDYYFKLSGTVGVIGLLYGKIDFAIISATINVKIVLSLQITYESYRAIPLVATASVDVSLTVKINLGLFSISISFSFHMKVTAQFVIGADETAPWDGASTLPLMQTSLLHAGPDAVTARAALLQPRLKTVVRKAGVTVPTLKVLASPQFTVLAPEAATAYKQQQGAFVFLLAMDAPTATSTTSTGNTSFDQLAAAFFPWVIDALSQSQGDEVDLEDASATIVTREQLEAYVKKLADLADPPLNMPGLLNFMASSFILNIETPAYAKSSGDQSLFQQGASVFPVFDGLSLTVPDPAGGSATKPVTFETYATATSSYRQFVAETFAEVEANIEAENQSQAPKTQNAVDDPESMAALIFIDYFSMMGRQLLQAARNLLDGYAYPLQSTDSIASIITAANALGNNLQIADVAVPNQDHQLTPNLSITLPPSSYAIQSTDTLNSIAAQFSDTNSSPRWTTTPAQLISANGTARILLPGISLTINSKTYTTVPGDSFQSIADAFAITLPALAQQTILYNTRPLLVSASQMIVPGITYKTGTSDTLSTVAAQFATTVPLLAGASSTVQGLFSTAAEQGVITLANLQAWSVGGLWTAIQTTDQVAQTAGMVSRFLMYGLRLPSAAGLSLSSQFLFPAGQKEYALYQLTGQEFPTSAPATVKSFPVTVNAAASSHKVNLSFIQFNGAAGSGTAIDLTAPYASLSTVLTWAQGGSFQPSPSFAVLPQSIPQPKQFAANNYAYWTTSDLAGLQSLTNRGSSSNGNSSGQMQPTLWPLPSGLLSLTEARQATLSPLVGDMKKMIPLLPEFQPQRGQTSPAGQQTKYSDLDNWAWTTRVDFQIKRLPVGGASSGGAGDTPNGAASAPTLPNVYEVIGASTEGAQTLELLLRSMDSLGEDIVSGLFLLYPQSGSNISLTTLGAQEFLAFMTQTNLSTETNPARSLSLALATLSTAPRGIANAPGEFIKLLWELSVVRSGGYFLFYQVVDGGGGLPASIFDPSGTATMSMVVTFAAQGAFSFGEIAPGFVNSFVTTDNLNTATDAVQLISQPTSGASLPLTGLPGETIATLSALYGAGPGAIVESNQTIPLKTGAVVPIAGIVRQLTQADVTNPGQTLANLATYYSQGAQTAITAADIQNFNPGVQVALGAVFYIPPVNYVVNAVNAPGNTFAKMAAYYALSLDALAVNALNVGGLFSQNTVLAVNTQVFDLRSTLGPGNVSFELSRTNYGDPPDNPADPGYPQTYMYSLYNNLSAGLLSNVYTKSDSPMGLPFGPQVENDEQEQAFASHAKLAEHRRALLAAATLDDFEYTQSIGFAQFAQINPAPSNPAPGSPPASANPYVGVGGTLQIALRWQDIFGNTTITPFSQPPTSYKGALNGSAATVLYSDRLVGLSGWTSTMSNYIYAGTAGSPVLNLSLTFDPTPYIGNAGQAKRDLALYQKIYFQLNQDYTNLNVPGVNDNAVTMSLSNSLLASPVNSLSPAQAGSIRGYVSACVQYLAAIVHASTPQPVPSALVSFPVSVGDIDSSSNIIELDVTLVLTRNPLLTDPAIASLTDGLSVSGTVLPKPDVGEQPGEEPAYVGFATAFETVFKTADWYMKVGEGMQLESDAGDNNTALQLWAVRFGTATGQGIFFQIVEDEPSYYAPKPIATTLASKTVQIVDYTTQNTITASFNGVDQNQWFQTCLDAIDTFLSATDSTSTFILDKLLGTDDPLKDGYLGLVLQAKESLANSISSAVEPILSTSLADSSTRWFAQQKLRQQFLNQIGAAYAAGAAVVYEVNDVSGASSDNPAGPPNLYGQPGGQIPGSDNQGNQNFTLTASRIPLAQTKDNGNIYDPRLCFVFTTKNVAGQAYVPLNLTLDITHLEFNRSTVPGIEGYVQSQWLVFVNGPFSYDLNTNTAADIPVVNRNLPTPPTVQEQTAGQVYFSPAVSPEVPPTTPLDLTQWNYSFEYLYRFAAQDTVRTTIQLNVPTSSVSAAAFTSGPDLFTALAQFVSSYPAILADFGEYLVKIDAETSEPTDKATIDGAKKAVDAFQTYLNQVAVAYAASLVPLTAAFAALPKLVEIDFETALDTDPQTGGARTNILNLQINEIDATWDSSAGTISNGVVTLPAVVLAIAPDQYTPVVPTDAESLSYVYQLTGSKPAKYLPYDAALNNPLRTVSLPNLDVLLYQNGLAEISVDRNRILFPVGSAITTNPDFIFTTPWVSFSNPVVPRLTYATFSLDGAGTSGESLEQLLNDFFAGLFTGGDGTVSVEATMTGMYNYQMQTGFPVSLPICLLPPVETPVSPTMIPTFTSVVAAAVADWIKQQHPTTGGNAQVGFKLTLFGSEEKQPLMVIDDLYHAVSGNGTAQSQTAAPAKRKPQRKRRR